MDDSKEIDGNHYRTEGKDLFFFCRSGLLSKESYMGALTFNVFKYLMRFQHKGTPLKDLKKARNYLNEMIDIIEQKETQKRS